MSRTGDVRMWKCSDGTPVPVVYDGGSGSSTESKLKLYLNHSKDDDVQTLTINDYTYLTNRATLKNNGNDQVATVVAMKALTSGDYNTDVTVDADKNKNDVRPAEVFVNLDAGVNMIGPECAIPLQTSIANLRAIPEAVHEWHSRH